MFLEKGWRHKVGFVSLADLGGRSARGSSFPGGNHTPPHSRFGCVHGPVISRRGWDDLSDVCGVSTDILIEPEKVLELVSDCRCNLDGLGFRLKGIL